MGNPDINQEKLREVAREVHLDELIMSLPAQYNTVIGEHGARLSSGQAQRLALGRALLTRAPFILMDEPASHLDLMEEKYLSDILEELSRSRTIVMIGHRIASLRKADQIILLDKGRVAESGVHSDLIEQQGKYYGLITAARENL
jgi:ABC-type multidrug transport system fused ATPase/permease subunit